MSLVTDTLATVFTVVGVNQTIAAFQSVENAQRRLAQSEEKAYYNPGTSSAKALANAQATAQQAQQRVSASIATATATFIVREMRSIAGAVQEATDSYVAFANQVMNVRDLTGASAAESARATTLFRAAGIADAQAVRDILRLSRAEFGGQGQQALSRLGLGSDIGQSGLSLFNSIANALQKVPNGIEKARIETELFGARGVSAILPLLRMTREQRSQFEALSGTNEGALEAVQRFQVANALLGATFEQKVAYPIVALILPALSGLVNGVTYVVDLFGQVNRATDGWAGTVIVIGAMATGFALLINTIGSLITLIGAMNIVLGVQNALLAIRDALLGPAGWIALGVAGVTIAGIAAFAAGGNDARDAHTQATRENTEALRDVRDTWNSVNRGGVPRGINGYDVQQIARQNALAFVG